MALSKMGWKNKDEALRITASATYSRRAQNGFLGLLPLKGVTPMSK